MTRLPKTASKTRHLGGGAWNAFSLVASEGTNSTHTWSRLLPPELWDSSFAVWAPGCGNALQQPREITQGSLRKHHPSRDRNEKSPGKIRGKGVPRNRESQCGAEAALSGSQGEGDKDRGQLVQILQGPDQELGMCSQGGGKPPEGAGQGAVLSAPFGETTLEINTREASTPCLGHISTNTWHSVTVIFMVPT